MDGLRKRVRRSLERNAPEIKAFLTGQMPSFVTGIGGLGPRNEIPVFVFHEVEPARLESQFYYLRSNGYSTVTADELEEAARGERKCGPGVALTFDDATWTFWTYGYPLLKKYDFRAILFAIPGIVPEDAMPYPNLEDVWKGRCSREELDSRARIQPLCTWRELVSMHESGIVDVQSHSLTHARVSVSPRLVDFLHPAFPSSIRNLNVPLSPFDNPEDPARELRLGAPVFESAPRLACRLWFKEAPELIEALTGYVEKHGGPAFFKRSTWRKELVRCFRAWPGERLGSFETSEEMDSAVTRELGKARNILEDKLTKGVRHLAYPWFGGSSMADRIAEEVGYRTLHYGPDISSQNGQRGRTPIGVRRISEEYLFRLPGEDRSSIWSIWARRAHNFIS